MQHREMTLFPGQPMRIYSVPDSITTRPDKWCVQIKKNGHRAIVRCDEPGKVTMIDRHGRGELTASKRHEWRWLCDVFAPPFVLDGELVGPRQVGTQNYRLVVWDMVLHGGESLLNRPYGERAERMAWIIGSHKIPFVRVNHERWGVAALSCINEYGADPEGIGCANVSVLLSKIPDPDGEDEGFVFKRTDVPLAWHTRPGVEDPNQLKLRRKG